MRIERETQLPVVAPGGSWAHVGSVWAVASPDEAYELLESLVVCFCPDDCQSLMEMIRAARKPDVDWHAHVGQPDVLSITLEG